MSTAESGKQFHMRGKVSAIDWLVEPVAHNSNHVTLTAAAEHTSQGWYLTTLGGDSHVRLCDLEPDSDRIVWLAKAGAQTNLWHFTSVAGTSQDPQANQLSCCLPTADGSEQLVLGRNHSWELVPVSDYCTSAGKLARQAVGRRSLAAATSDISPWEELRELYATGCVNIKPWAL